MTNNNSFVRRLCLLLVVVCTSLMASAQTAVKGNVTDEKGEPIMAQWKFSGDKHKSLQVYTERTFHQRYPLAML